MMDGYIVLAIVAIQAVGHLLIAMHKEKRYQSTIDRLTDKLMAKDYGEYKRNNHITISDEKPQRKPMSFYDDPCIDIDEDSVV